MADYNLGTAHGRIVIDLDDKGSAETVRAMRKMDAEADKASARFEQFAKHCDQIEDQLKEVVKALDRLDADPIRRLEDANQLGANAARRHSDDTNRLRASVAAAGAVMAGVGSQGANKLRAAGSGVVGVFAQADRQIKQTSVRVELFNYIADYADKTVGRFNRTMDMLKANPLKEFAERGQPAMNVLNGLINKATVLTGVLHVLGAVAVGVGAAGLTTMSHVAVGLGAAIVQMSGAAGLIPSIMMAGALAIGTLKVATSGMGDAMKAAATGDVAKMNEAIKDMPPPMQETVRAVGRLAPALKALKLDVQSKFWAGMGQHVDALGGKYLPIVQSAMGRVATGFNAGMKSAASFYEESRTQAEVNGMLNNCATAVNAITTRFGGLVRIFHVFAAVGSEFLPALANGLGRGIDRVTAFVSSAEGIDKIRGWIAGGISAIGKFFNILRNVAYTIGAVFKIANDTGSGFLDKLLQLTWTMRMFAQSTEGAEAIGGIFNMIKAASDAVLPAIIALVKVIGKQLAPGFVQLIGLIGPKLVPFIEAFGDGIARLMSATPALAQIFNRLMDAITPLLPALGQALADNIKFFAQALAIVAPPLQALINLFTSLPVPLQSAIIGFLLIAPTFLKITFAILKFNAVLGIVSAIIGRSSLLMGVFGISADKAGKKMHTLRRIISTVSKPLGALINLGAKLGRITWLTKGLSKLLSITGPLGKVLGAFTRFSRIASILRGVGGAAKFMLSFMNIAKFMQFFLHPIAGSKRMATAVVGAFKRMVVAAYSWIAAQVRAAASAVASAARTTAAWVASAARTVAGWVAAGARIVATYTMIALRATLSAIKTSAAWIASGLRAAGAWIAFQVRSLASFLMVAVRAAMSAAASALSWVMAGVRAAGSWLLFQIRSLASFAMVVARAVLSGAATALAWIASGIRAAGAWLLFQIRSLASFAMVAVRAAISGAATALSWIMAGIRAAGAWLLFQVQSLIAFVTVAARAVISALVSSAAWVGAGVRAAGAWILFQVQSLAAFTVVAARATASGAASAAAWVGAGARAAGAWVAMQVRSLAAFAMTATSAAISAASAAGAWLAAGARAGAAWLVMQARAAAAFIATAAAATTSAAGAAAGWLATNAAIVGSFILMSVQAVARMAITVAATVTGWIIMAASSMAGAITMAAAWFIALGPIGWVIAIVVALVALIILNWDTIKNWTISAFTAVRDFFVGIWNAIYAFVVNLVAQIVIWIVTQWVTLQAQWTAIWTGIQAFFTGIWNAIMNFVIGIIVSIVTWIVTKWLEAQAMTQAAFNAIRSAVQNAINTVLSIVLGIIGRIVGFFASSWASIQATVRGAWAGIQGAVSAGANAVAGFVASLVGKIKGFFSGAGQWLLDAGRAIMRGLLDGIIAAWNAVVNFLSGLAAKIKSLKGPEKKDAKLLIDEGKAIMAGLHEGMESRADTMLKWVGDMADKVGAMANGQRLADRLGQLGKDAITQLAQGMHTSEDKVRAAIDRIRETLQGVGNVNFNDIIERVKAAAGKAGVNLAPYLSSSGSSGSTPETRAPGYGGPTPPTPPPPSAPSSGGGGDTYYFNTTLPQGASVKDLSDTVVHDLRHAGKGVYR